MLEIEDGELHVLPGGSGRGRHWSSLVDLPLAAQQLMGAAIMMLALAALGVLLVSAYFQGTPR